MPFHRLLLPLFVLLLGLTRAAAQDADPDVSTVRHVDLARYMGRWNVIAHVPNLLEHGKVGTADVYTQLPDGTMRSEFVFRRHVVTAPEEEWSGTAWVVDSATNASWKLRLFWPFWPFASGYRVLELDPNYGWAVVSTSSGSLFWVLARGPQLDQYTYREILDRLRRRRLDPARLELVPQAPVASALSK